MGWIPWDGKGRTVLKKWVRLWERGFIGAIALFFLNSGLKQMGFGGEFSHKM